jgi:hypothetical protein
LEIGPQLFHVNAAGDLTAFDLAWVGTNISVVQQPSEMVFYLANMAREGKLFRGLPGRSVEAVLVQDPAGPQAGIPQKQFSVFIVNNTTNDLLNYVLPSPEEGLGLTLYDEQSNEVPRTPLGGKLGHPLALEGQSASSQFLRRGRLFLNAKDAAQGGQFNLLDYFDVKAPGTYKLVFVQRLYRLETNGKIGGAFLPVIVAPIEITTVPIH